MTQGATLVDTRLASVPPKLAERGEGSAVRFPEGAGSGHPNPCPFDRDRVGMPPDDADALHFRSDA